MGRAQEPTVCTNTLVILMLVARSPHLETHCSARWITWSSSFFFFFNFYLFICYFWLCWVFVSVRGLSLVAASGSHSSSRCAGLSLSRPLLLRSSGSVGVVHGSSCSAACGIFPDQGSNPCPLHWQADSQPLRHQGSPTWSSLNGLSWLHLPVFAHIYGAHIASPFSTA